MLSHRDHRHPNVRKSLIIGGALLGTYALLAYVALAWAWTHYEHQKGLAGRPMVTHTAQGIPGDALNVGLVGSRDDVIPAALVAHTAQWLPDVVDLSGRVYPGLTHSVSQEELDDVGVFLRKRLEA